MCGHIHVKLALTGQQVLRVSTRGRSFVQTPLQVALHVRVRVRIPNPQLWCKPNQTKPKQAKKKISKSNQCNVSSHRAMRSIFKQNKKRRKEGAKRKMRGGGLQPPTPPPLVCERKSNTPWTSLSTRNTHKRHPAGSNTCREGLCSQRHSHRCWLHTHPRLCTSHSR